MKGQILLSFGVSSFLLEKILFQKGFRVPENKQEAIKLSPLSEMTNILQVYAFTFMLF